MRKAYKWLPFLLIGIETPLWAAVPEAWKHTAYAYDAQQTDLATTLGGFAREFGLVLDMPPMEGVLNGRFRAKNPQAFLDRLGQEHHFQWFVYNDTLFVSPTNGQTSARIEVSSDGLDDLQEALTDVGLLDPRFGWGVLSEQGVVLVRGPEKYVEFIREFIGDAAGAGEAEKQEVIVLPLKYANAADRSIRYRDEQMTVPGVASMLQELLGARSRGESIAAGKFGSLPASPLGSAQNAAYGNTGYGALDTTSLEQGLDRVLGGNVNRSSAGSIGAKKTRIAVSADVRNNAVLIYDLPHRKVLYQKLVEQLDVPRQLIEIDAIILDIDRHELAELSSRWNFKSGSVSGSANMLEGGRSTLFIQDAGKFAAELRALEGNGSASVIGNPSILTLENHPAVIDFSRTEFLKATAERVASITPIIAGTSLQVIPRSLEHNGKSQVELIVDIEDGQIDPSQIDDTQPSVRKGNISTQAVIAERGSLVIGGLHAVEANEKIKKIPLLGDIPVLGKLLFQWRNREVNNRERLFILTPRLVGDQINPSRYVENGNPHDLDEQMRKIAARRDNRFEPTRGDVQQAFKELLNGTTPVGLRSGEELPFAAQSLCAPENGLELDSQSSQWFAHDDWGVAVVVARNNGSKPLRLDEGRCGGRWVIGVSAWPHAWLQPGEESEVFIAMRQPQTAKQTAPARASLLQRVTP
ncbi:MULTISPECIES: type III secretion system outer membrane ring subunit SctC [Pseudomonas]|uniref:Type 3 secretion system secretin n=1 Tax=Pseudomonas wuhanensis TaxID=2954098 RepID=A0ABY9GL96_9PSED|nr:MULTISPECIES: type III secretion system outer membrane ring subunit SctC [unclassified Pseudomonas]WLI10717.1 type III secretion system outer membrane ring subunit SctC [Pseudomonas sp. FP603]WLI16533.1 type III secretion system outer membrane ring subunit SctC [Pseudomonas sp. FP607]